MGDQILDLVLTNLPDMYDKNGVQTLPPFNLVCQTTIHNVVVMRPKTRAPKDSPNRKTLLKRDTRATSSRKSELGRFFSSIDWAVADYAPDWETKLALFIGTVRNGLDHIMATKRIRLHTDDPSWITAQF